MRQEEKPFVLVLMPKMLFQKAAGKLLVDRSAHHGTFKQNITGAPFTKMLYWKLILPDAKSNFLSYCI